MNKRGFNIFSIFPRLSMTEIRKIVRERDEYEKQHRYDQNPIIIDHMNIIPTKKLV